MVQITHVHYTHALASGLLLDIGLVAMVWQMVAGDTTDYISIKLDGILEYVVW